MTITMWSPSFPVGILKIVSEQKFQASTIAVASNLMILYNIVAWPLILSQI